MSCLDGMMFCPVCHDFREVKPRLKNAFIKCYTCGNSEPLEEAVKSVLNKPVRIYFPKSALIKRLEGQKEGSRHATEAVVNEECPKCKHPQLSYHTAQLRGLDEGQTIFYTCLNDTCGHKFTVNS